MRQSKYITIITMACALFFASCSDEYMENMNTDPSKAATIDPNAQLTTAQLQTYGDLSMMEIYRNYHYAFTQQLMGCWNTTNYGGRHTLDNNEMSRIWTSFYTQSLKNIIYSQISHSRRCRESEHQLCAPHLSGLSYVYHHRHLRRRSFQ